MIAKTVVDVEGKTVTPGFVDSHTHMIYAGTGLKDFEILTHGGSRVDLVNAGCGVRGMVNKTRLAEEEELFCSARARCIQLISAGVTTLESKSGAGLDLDTELKMMRVSRRLGRELPLTVISTFLGAHGVAPEYEGRPDAYIDFLIKQVLPVGVREGLVDAVDGFCDAVGFNHKQIDRLFDAAKQSNLPVRLHADQYSDAGAGGLAAKWQALTADHLEYLSEPGIKAMARAGTVATLLPGANYVLHETRKPPVEQLRKYQVPIAIATNHNPVSSPSLSPPMIMNLACHHFGLTPEEALAGFTRNGARALGLDRMCGSLEKGKFADLAVWNVDHPMELSYHIGMNPCFQVVKKGNVIYQASSFDVTFRKDDTL